MMISMILGIVFDWKPASTSLRMQAGLICYSVLPPHKVGLELLQCPVQNFPVIEWDNKTIVQALLGLGILTPPSVTTVKSEHGTLSPHQGTLSHQYNLLDPGTGVSSVVTDLTTLQVLEILELCDFILHVYN